jgi:hypothetical protein
MIQNLLRISGGGEICRKTGTPTAANLLADNLIAYNPHFRSIIETFQPLVSQWRGKQKITYIDGELEEILSDEIFYQLQILW